MVCFWLALQFARASTFPLIRRIRSWYGRLNRWDRRKLLFCNYTGPTTVSCDLAAPALHDPEHNIAQGNVTREYAEGRGG